MDDRRITIALYGLVIAALLGAVGLGWLNYQFVPRLPAGDYFQVYWEGSHSLLREGLSPYSPEVAERITQRSIRWEVDDDFFDLRFKYPLFAGIVFLPFSLFGDFQFARALWLTALELAILATVWASLRLTGWRASWPMWTALAIVALLWYHGLVPVVLGSVIIITGLLVTLAFSALRAGLDELAGLCLALSAIYPEAVALLLLFVAFWAISTSRWRVLVWMLGGLLLLSGLAMLVLPDWPLQYLRVLLNDYGGNVFRTPGDIFRYAWPGLATVMARGLTVLVATLLIVEWWLARGKDFRWFLWTACLTLVLTPWSGLPSDPANFILLWTPLVLVFSGLVEGWGRRIDFLIFIFLGLLVGGFWVFFFPEWQQAFLPQRQPFLFAVMPLFLLFGLYWVRWRVTRPRRMLLSDLREL